MIERPDLPLFAHADRRGDAERFTQDRRNRLGRGGAVGVAGFALLGLTIACPPLPRLVWNASASAPIGLYAASPGATIRRGDMVVAWAPPGPRRLAAERHYLPINVPLVKRVAGIAGDRVCATAAVIWIGNRRAVVRKKHDAAGRAMPWWDGCVTLRGSELLLLNDPLDSFDGRYFGPTARRDVIGRATPLWVH